MQDHDFLQPILCGDVVDERVRVVRGSIRAAQTDEHVGAAELSFARHVARVAKHDESWVAVPAFVRRGFSHRAWFVRRGSNYANFSDLVGKRIGTNEWAASGNTWARAAAREQGVLPSDVEWVVGSINGGAVARVDPLPPHGRYADTEEALAGLLIRGDLDALVCPDPPDGFYDSDSQVVRLLDDFRAAERAYYHRTGVFPAYHVVGVRRHVFEQDPGLLDAIFDLLSAARRLWSSTRLAEGDTSPWLLADLEETMALIGKEWQPYGVDENLRVIEYFCDELLAQGMIERRVSVSEVFADFTRLCGTTGA
jgi:4,5-dihydroxyphthalate decarboxylase